MRRWQNHKQNFRFFFSIFLSFYYYFFLLIYMNCRVCISKSINHSFWSQLLHSFFPKATQLSFKSMIKQILICILVSQVNQLNNVSRMWLNSWLCIFFLVRRQDAHMKSTSSCSARVSNVTKLRDVDQTFKTFMIYCFAFKNKESRIYVTGYLFVLGQVYLP